MSERTVIYLPLHRVPAYRDRSVNAFLTGGKEGLRKVLRRHFAMIEEWLGRIGATDAEIEAYVDEFCRAIDQEIHRRLAAGQDTNEGTCA